MHSPKKRHQSYTLLYAETAGGEQRRSHKKKSIPKQELKNGLGRRDGPTSSYIEKNKLTNKKRSTTVLKKQGSVLLKS